MSKTFPEEPSDPDSLNYQHIFVSLARLGDAIRKYETLTHNDPQLSHAAREDAIKRNVENGINLTFQMINDLSMSEVYAEMIINQCIEGLNSDSERLEAKNQQ